MKKYISKLAKVLLVSALCPLMQSCFNLDEEWYSEVTPDTFFKTKENIYSIANRPFTHGFWYEGTTAKPFPASPALAASIEALSERRLV